MKELLMKFSVSLLACLPLVFSFIQHLVVIGGTAAEGPSAASNNSGGPTYFGLWVQASRDKVMLPNKSFQCNEKSYRMRKSD